MLFDEIVDHQVDRTETIQQDTFVVSNNVGKRSGETTKGWEIMIHLKCGSTTWYNTKDVK